MKIKTLFVVCIAALGSLATAGEGPYRAKKGDTLWELSARYWSDPNSWPELWAVNPHFRNPHRISPGDPVFLARPSPEELQVRLPFQRLEPAAPAAPESASPPAAQAVPAAAVGAGLARTAPAGPISLARRGSQDFVSSHRILRFGAVWNRRQVKVAYAAGEDVELELTRDSTLRPGDLATVFDDSAAVVHPVNRQPQGYHVRVLGHLRIDSVSGRRAVGRLFETYDVIQDGAGVMGRREPVANVALHARNVGVEGVLLQAGEEKSLFATDDVVFLDKGSLHGMEPGLLLDVPVPLETRFAQGAVDLTRPLARLVVISVEDKTAAGLVVDSRAALSAGDRFVAAAFSP